MPPVDDWTLPTLKEHLESLLAEERRANAQRFEAQEKAVQAALQAAKEAVAKAEIAAEKRFDSVNEFRGQLTDQAATFMPRREAEQRIGQVADKADAETARTNANFALISSRLDVTQGRSGGLNASWGYLVAAITVAGVLVAIVIALNGAHP